MGCQLLKNDNVLLYNNNYTLPCSQYDNMSIVTANGWSSNDKHYMKNSNVNFIQAAVSSNIINCNHAYCLNVEAPRKNMTDINLTFMLRFLSLAKKKIII